MNDPFCNALIVEMRDLLAQDKVFEKDRAAKTGFEGILVSETWMP